jgi:hypothetical protein
MSAAGPRRWAGAAIDIGKRGGFASGPCGGGGGGSDVSRGKWAWCCVVASSSDASIPRAAGFHERGEAPVAAVAAEEAGPLRQWSVLGCALIVDAEGVGDGGDDSAGLARTNVARSVIAAASVIGCMVWVCAGLLEDRMSGKEWEIGSGDASSAASHVYDASDRRR